MTRCSPFPSARLLLLATLLLPGAAAAEAPSGERGVRQLTVESIFGEKPILPRLLSGLEFAPDGASLTYLAPERGTEGPGAIWRLRIEDRKREVLVAADVLPERPAPAGEGAQSKGAPERLRIGGYQWSPTGAHLLLRGGGDLFTYRLADRALRRLTATEADESDAKFSPDGKWIAFVRDHNLHAVSADGGPEVALTAGGDETVLMGEADWVTCEELSLCSPFWWSPDSRRVAFLKFDQQPVYRHPIVDWLPPQAEIEWERYPKAGDANAVVSLGVVAVSDPQVRWIPAGVAPDGYIARVDWSVDGAALLVQRLDRKQERLELARIDPEGAREPQVLITESDAQWVNVSDGMRQLADGRILWDSERDGWRHLYLFAADGKLLRRLTEGEWAVEEVAAVDEKGGFVYFTSTEKSVLERHLYRVGIDGRGMQRLSAEDGNHRVAFDPKGKSYVDWHSGRELPTAMFLRRADGSLVEDLVPGARAALDGFATPGHRFLEIPAGDGARLQASLLTPADFDPSRRYPVVISVYGGPEAQMVRDAWNGPGALWDWLLAERGFLVFSLDGRGSGGRGHAWEAAIDRRLGKRELEDQLAGVRYLKSLPYVDPDRLALFGWSYGGYMTLYALTNAPGVFRVGIAGAPVTDWRYYDTIYTERYLDLPKENPDGYRDSSPVNQAASLRGNLLLIHGTGDDNVHLQNSIAMLQALTDQGIPYDLRIYPRQLHGFQDRKARIHLYQTILRYLLDRL